MVESLTQGGVYLAKLSPAKTDEVGKVRPVVVLTTQLLLDKLPPVVFICPLSSQSYPEFKPLHIEISARDNLQVVSYALSEHCRAISAQRMMQPRLAQLSTHEIKMITSRLSMMISVEANF